MRAYAPPIGNRNLVAGLLIAALVLGTVGFLASLDWMVVLSLVPFVGSFVVAAREPGQ